MTTLTDRRAAQKASRERATAEFGCRHGEIETLLARLQSASDNHYGHSPESAGWDAAGSVGHIVELLTQAVDHAEEMG